MAISLFYNGRLSGNPLKYPLTYPLSTDTLRRCSGTECLKTSIVPHIHAQRGGLAFASGPVALTH